MPFRVQELLAPPPTHAYIHTPPGHSLSHTRQCHLSPGTAMVQGSSGRPKGGELESSPAFLKLTLYCNAVSSELHGECGAPRALEVRVYMSLHVFLTAVGLSGPE